MSTTHMSVDSFYPRARLRVLVCCQTYRSCERTVEVWAKLTGSIGDGGCIDLVAEFETPEGWENIRGNLLCPEHRE